MHTSGEYHRRERHQRTGSLPLSHASTIEGSISDENMTAMDTLQQIPHLDLQVSPRIKYAPRGGPAPEAGDECHKLAGSVCEMG